MSGLCSLHLSLSLWHGSGCVWQVVPVLIRNKCYKNYQFATTRKAIIEWHVKTGKNLVGCLKACKYSTHFLLQHALVLVKYILCCFMCVTEQWALHTVIKRQFCYICICTFSMSFNSWKTNTSDLDKKWPPCWNFTAKFDLGGITINKMWFCLGLLNCVQNGPPQECIATNIIFSPTWDSRSLLRPSKISWKFDHNLQ